MTTSFKEIQTAAQKTRLDAKAVRSEWKGQEDSDRKEAALRRALGDLQAAIDALTPWDTEDSAYRREAKQEIGDCYGVRGGTYRDFKYFEEAAVEYGRGLAYERDVERLGGKPNSYCLIQRLVSLVLARPAAFVKGEPVDGSNLHAELVAALATVTAQIRDDDPWAAADVALLSQLLAVDTSAEWRSSARAAWNKLDDLRPKRNVYDSTLDVLREIAARVGPYVDPDTANELSRVLRRLAPR